MIHQLLISIIDWLILKTLTDRVIHVKFKKEPALDLAKV